MTLSKNAERYISGIHNYCDKWCERCRMCNKCQVFTDTEEKKAEHVRKGENPDDINLVLQDAKNDFEKTMSLLKKITEKEAIDQKKLQEKEGLFPNIKKYPLNIDSLDYMGKAHAFAKKVVITLKTEKKALVERIKIIPSPFADLEQFEEIIDHYEIIAWYLTLIPIKIYRALSSKMGSVVEKDDALAQINMEDANGSAKVAFAGIERSIAALQKIYKRNESLQNEALDLMVQADRMRKCLNAEFSGHHSFKRPGFEI